MRKKRQPPLYQRIREILESARAGVARSVNTTQVISNWLVGREIVEEEQKGKTKAGYGDQLLNDLAVLLIADFGKGYSATNLRWFRQFYLSYPALVPDAIHHALRDKFRNISKWTALEKHHALRVKSDAARRKSSLFVPAEIGYAPRSESWKPGRLHPNLSWTHYRTLLRVDKSEPRAFYEIEALRNNWSARELERQINSLLYERLALSS